MSFNQFNILRDRNWVSPSNGDTKVSYVDNMLIVEGPSGFNTNLPTTPGLTYNVIVSAEIISSKPKLEAYFYVDDLVTQGNRKNHFQSGQTVNEQIFTFTATSEKTVIGIAFDKNSKKELSKEINDIIKVTKFIVTGMGTSTFALPKTESN